MPENNKAILEAANAAMVKGDYEGFLAFCTEDTQWTFVGDQTLNGKEAVREWMATAYTEPPEFTVTNMIAEGDFVIAIGSIVTKDEEGEAVTSSYCDVWQVREGKLAGLRAFVIESES